MGTLPDGFRWHGSKTAPGIGYVQVEDLRTLLLNPDVLSRLRVLSWQMAEIWQGLSDHNVENDARDLILAINKYVTLVTDAGLTQPTKIEPFSY